MAARDPAALAQRARANGQHDLAAHYERHPMQQNLYDPARRQAAEAGIPAHRTTSTPPGLAQQPQDMGWPGSPEWSKQRACSAQAFVDFMHAHLGEAGDRLVRALHAASPSGSPIMHQLSDAMHAESYRLDTDYRVSDAAVKVGLVEADRRLADYIAENHGEGAYQQLRQLLHSVPGMLHEKQAFVRLLHAALVHDAGHLPAPPTPHHPQTTTVPGKAAGSTGFTSAAAAKAPSRAERMYSGTRIGG